MGIVQGFVPVVDGSVIPRQPFGAGAPPEAAGIPLIIGSTRTEMAQYAFGSDPALLSVDDAGLVGKLRPLLGEETGAIVAGYRQNHPALSSWDLYLIITADWPTRLGSIEIAEKQGRQAPVYMYRVDWNTPVRDGIYRSPHAIEISLIFRTIETAVAMTGGGPRAAQFSDRISESWAAFARTAVPDAPGLPRWPAYETSRRATMIFDDVPSIQDDPDGGDRELLTPLWREHQDRASQ
jgi:para-nitrobenzyl esterase